MWPRSRMPDARCASVDATPLISGGYVSVTMHTWLATTTIVAADARRTPVKNRLPDCGVTVSFAMPANRSSVTSAPRRFIRFEPDL